MKKKVLLTGGTGFIGQHCIPVLLENGFEVYATFRTTIPEDNLSDVIWIQADLLHDMHKVKEILKNGRIDYLLHLAWDVTPGEYQNSANNLSWLKASLDLVKAFICYGGKRIVTAGTCFEYDFADGILEEETTLLRPDTLYGECKAAMYRVLQHFCQVENVSYAHGRIFYVFGPGEDPRRVVPYVITELSKGHRPKCGSGIQELDYLYVKDVARAFAELLDTDVRGPVNIGSGEKYSLRSFLEQIENSMNLKDMIEFAAPAAGDTKQVVADSTRLREEVGWISDYTIKSGVTEFIKLLAVGEKN